MADEPGFLEGVSEEEFQEMLERAVRREKRRTKERIRSGQMIDGSEFGPGGPPLHPMHLAQANRIAQSEQRRVDAGRIVRRAKTWVLKTLFAAIAIALILAVCTYLSG